ncbi:hypothetical protein B0H13DRAFT_2407469 [Mycena leptocephala]|nr:hypothetical protein B0H13DRAFT_2407469 [Mycena leptocephala]
MNNEKALMLTVKDCLIAFFNKMFGNSGETALLDCIEGKRRLPCSNCLPHFIGPLFFPPSPLPIDAPPLASFPSPDIQPSASAPVASGIPKKPRKLTKAMRVAADTELCLFKERVHKAERDRVSHGYTPASSYLPNLAITSILDNFLTISTVNGLTTIIPKWKHHHRHGTALFELIQRLQATFAAEFEAARLQKMRPIAPRQGPSAAQISRMKKCPRKRKMKCSRTMQRLPWQMNPPHSPSPRLASARRLKIRQTRSRSPNGLGHHC